MTTKQIKVGDTLEVVADHREYTREQCEDLANMVKDQANEKKPERISGNDPEIKTHHKEPTFKEVKAMMKKGQSEPSVAMMLQEVIKGGITRDNVSALESLVGLYDRMQAKQAERDFAVDFNRFMSEMPRIEATKPVPNNDGTIRYRFAPLEELEAIVRPIALRNGFSYSFSEAPSEPGRITKICTVQHASGHQRIHPFTVRTSAPPKANDSQADGSTHSYAKRGAFSDAFSIIVEHDDDARMIGQSIGKALAEDLEARVKACGADREAFLKYAGAKDFTEISDERWPVLDELLKRKEAAKVAREKLSPESEQWK